MTRIEKAIYYVKQQISHKSPYVWGGQGEKLKKLTCNKLCQMETSADNAARVIKFIKTAKPDKKAKIYDCSGLQIEAMRYAGLSLGDTTANGLMNKFPRVSRETRQAGDLCFKCKGGEAYHVGMLLDRDTVGEAAGRDVGCIASGLNDKWTVFCRPW